MCKSLKIKTWVYIYIRKLHECIENKKCLFPGSVQVQKCIGDAAGGVEGGGCGWEGGREAAE